MSMLEIHVVIVCFINSTYLSISFSVDLSIPCIIEGQKILISLTYSISETKIFFESLVKWRWAAGLALFCASHCTHDY